MTGIVYGVSMWASMRVCFVFNFEGTKAHHYTESLLLVIRLEDWGDWGPLGYEVHWDTTYCGESPAKGGGF